MTLYIITTYCVIIILVIAWLYLLIHAVQYIESPKQRALWVMSFLVFSLLAAAFYFKRHYVGHYLNGRGGLIKY